MNVIDVVTVTEGTKFDNPVFISEDDQFVLFAAGSVVKNEDLMRLRSWGVRKLYSSSEFAAPVVAEEEHSDYTIASHTPEPASVAPVSDRDIVSAIGSEDVIKQYNEVKAKKKRFIDIYNTAIQNMGVIYKAAKANQKLDLTILKNTVSSLVKEIQVSKNLFIAFTAEKDEGEYLPNHVVNVTILSIITGMTLGYNINQLLELGMAALLFDIGMVRLPFKLVNNQAKFSPEEFNQMKLHTLYGYQIITKENNLSNEIALPALQHHEQYDGNGYPQRLKGDQINEYAKIIAISDQYQAMIRSRPHRQESLGYDAMRQVLSESSHKFDPQVIRAFLLNMAIYPVGTLVRLNDQRVAIVVGANQNKPLRPTIKILFDATGRRVPPSDQNIINLIQNQTLAIMGAVDEKTLGAEKPTAY